MKITNKHAPKKFSVLDSLEAGIVLLGSEVKAIRQGHVDLSSAYVKIMGKEAFLINAKIFPYKYSRVENYQEDRTRKLLLHGKEIQALKSKLDTGNYTLAPLALYTKHNQFKLEIALVKGKKAHEQKKDSKRRAIERDRERELKDTY